MTDSDNDNDPQQRLIIRGTRISEDAQGRVCLNDLWTLARGRDSQVPRYWKNSQPAKALRAELEKYIRNSDNKPNTGVFPVIYAKAGRGNKGTFAHPIMAAAYAGYLSPRLEIEVREVWLRYRAGDANLADEILQRASAEDNHRVGVRALARSQRKTYTQTLKDHGVCGKEGYMGCTEAVYVHLLGGRSWELRQRLGLPPGSNVRDGLSAPGLAYVMAAEALSAERISDEQRQGNRDCAEASAISAQAIRRAIDEDRRNRQKRLMP
jgi:hypothetical protein